MFVRFRQSSRRLQLSLVETRREGGRVRHVHIASLGALPTPLTVAGRVAFWVRLHQRLERLSNRLGGEMQAIVGDVHARVPMPTVDEIRARQLEEAKQHETAWQLRQIQTESIVEANRALRDGAGKMVAEGEPLVVSAAKAVKAATARRERIERGELVPLPGKPPSLKQLGITPAFAQHAMVMHSLTPEQFERFLKFEQSSQRRDYARLRRFLRAEARR